MENKQNLRNICQRFFDYGIEYERLYENNTRNKMKELDVTFEQKYQSEQLDSIGSLYLLEVEYYCEMNEHDVCEIFSNILMTNYTEAVEQKKKLTELVEFAKNFIEQNDAKFDKLIVQDYDEILKDDDYEFIDEFNYMSEIAKYHTVDIACLQINNSDWQLDKYYNKFLTKRPNETILQINH